MIFQINDRVDLLGWNSLRPRTLDSFTFRQQPFVNLDAPFSSITYRQLMAFLRKYLYNLFTLLSCASLLSRATAFAPRLQIQSPTQSSHGLLAQRYASKSPLDQFLNFVESTQVSLQDYVFMRPSHPIPAGMRRVQTQFIAALGDPKASSGTDAQDWGIWRIDPGPRGVYLTQYKQGMKEAQAGWKFDTSEFWIEEYGRIMEKPDFPVPPGKYVVTGGRQVTTILRIDSMNESGQQNWSLQDGTLYDVTHLPCRAAKYSPTTNNGASPANAKVSDFPVTPGAAMPPVEGCTKQDYAVLFVLAVEDDRDL